MDVALFKYLLVFECFATPEELVLSVIGPQLPPGWVCRSVQIGAYLRHRCARMNSALEGLPGLDDLDDDLSLIHI